MASSRVRWAIVIESVLKITNAPTKSAIPPKPSRKPRMNERNEFTFFWSALACSSAVLTWTLPGTAERSSTHEPVGRDAGLRRDRDRP